MHRGAPPWLMAEFLKLGNDKGPTAARGRAAHLTWMANALRLSLHVSHPLVAPFKQTPRGHIPKQAFPFELRFLVHFENLVMSENCFVSHAAADSLLVAFGVVRWAHLQRSRLLGESPGSFMFECLRGKSCGGAAFLWTLCKRSVTGRDVAGTIVKGPNKKKKFGFAPYLLKAWCPFPGDPTSATSWAANPQLYVQAEKSRRKLLQLPP